MSQCADNMSRLNIIVTMVTLSVVTANISFPPLAQLLPIPGPQGSASSSCNCPCRTNHVTRCIQTYHTKCDPPPSYEDTQQQCSRYPVTETKNVTETECQVCRHVWDTEMVDSYKW